MCGNTHHFFEIDDAARKIRLIPLVGEMAADAYPGRSPEGREAVEMVAGSLEYAISRERVSEKEWFFGGCWQAFYAYAAYENKVSRLVAEFARPRRDLTCVADIASPSPAWYIDDRVHSVHADSAEAPTIRGEAWAEGVRAVHHRALALREELRTLDDECLRLALHALRADLEHLLVKYDTVLAPPAGQ